jgi:competence protein ComEA
MKFSSKILCSVAVGASLCLAVPADDEAKVLPDSPGKDVVAKVCIDCHDAGTFRKMRFNEDEWWEKVADMVDRGAKADDKQQAVIVGYLAKNFGRDSPILINSAPLSELIVILGLTPHESEAVVSYRTDYGPFKQWQDLLKVPGVDAKKIEAKKDKMAF